MEGKMACYCGHAEEEHARTKWGPGACEIDGCECICYDKDEDAPGDSVPPVVR
jgi:hypothetical protein